MGITNELNSIAMKIKPLLFAVLVCFSLALLSCAPVYVPNVINTPMLSNAGEVQLSVSSASSGFDPQFAAAITDHVGIMLNGSFSNRRYEDSDEYRKHKFFEVGVGYYRKIKENVRFETFGGYGFGKVQTNRDYFFWPRNEGINLRRFFIQPTIGATLQPFEGCVSARVVYVSLNRTDRNPHHVFIEPAITGKLVYKRFKGILQFGLSLPVSNYDLVLEHDLAFISVGLSVNIGKRNEQ